MSSHISLKTYISRHLGAVAILPVLIIASLTLGIMIPAIKTRTGTLQQDQASSIADQLSARLDGGERQLTALAAYINKRQFTPGSTLTDLLDTQCGNGEFFEVLFIIDDTTFTIQAAGLTPSRRQRRSDFIGMDLSGRRFIYAPKGTKKPAWSKCFLSTVNSRPAVALTLPLTHGFLVGELSLDNLAGFINTLSPKSELLTLIMDNQGTIVTDSQRRYWGKSLPDDGTTRTKSTNQSWTVSGAFEFNGLKLLGAVAKVEKTDWKILAAQPVHKAFEPLWDILTLIGMGLVIAMIIVLPIAWFLAGRFSRIFTSYAEQAASIAGGDYDISWPECKTKESLLLGQSLANMAQTIKQRERELKTEEQRTRDLLINVPGVIYQYTFNPGSPHTGTFSSPALERSLEMFGLDFEQKNFVNLFEACIPENDRARFRLSVKEAIESASPWHYEGKFIKPSGEEIWFDGRSHPRQTDGLISHYGVFTDITQRKELEASLRLTQFCFDKAPIGIWRMGKNGQVIDVNEQGYKSLGYSKKELCRMSVFDFAPGFTTKDWENAMDHLNRADPSPLESLHQNRNGEVFPIQVIQKLMVFEDREYCMAFVQDITERKQMEEIMIQNEKMLSVGGLAAGMAHEINNPLAGMVHTAQVMAQRLTADLDIPASRKAAKAADTSIESIGRFMETRGIPRMIQTIIESGQRVSEIVNNILSFSRKDETTISTHHLDKIINKTIELAATDYNLKKDYDFKQITITREYDDSLPAVPCQAGKLQQVVLNILTNGAQAMQEAGTLKPRFILRTYGDSDRDMACIEIEDNGPGMDKNVRKHIFDPFFTTKPVGVGTGLGLSVSYFIITENHKGEMTVESSPGAGAKFIIKLAVGNS
ncbi:PAS domain S-box protein [uncultured Desulfobacter sp.]|uniref:PAS domain S-box protein n=1 Tax=uncultured Desulfobacter sp. TaxID=240139 RepID=UPI0029F57172|nr:PAS domain S-box protein [uncultured Desulfobacter sp.]